MDWCHEPGGDEQAAFCDKPININRNSLTGIADIDHSCIIPAVVGNGFQTVVIFLAHDADRFFSGRSAVATGGEKNGDVLIRNACFFQPFHNGGKNKRIGAWSGMVVHNDHDGIIGLCQIFQKRRAIWMLHGIFQ